MSDQSVLEGTVLYWGRELRAERQGNGAVRFLFAERWVEANSMTASTFKARTQSSTE